MHAGLPFLEDDREEEAEKREGGGRDDFSSDLSEDDDDEDGGGGEYPAKPRVGVLAAESDRHSEFSVSADEDEQSNPNETKGGAREAKSKSIFDDTDGSSDEGGGLFDRRPPAVMTPSRGEDGSANGEEESEGDDQDDNSERDHKDGRKEIIKPKPVKPVLLGFAAELARKIGAPPPSSRPGQIPQAEIDPRASGDLGADLEVQRSKSSPPETKNENLEVVKVQKSRSAGNARERTNTSTKGLFEEDSSSSEDELFRPARAATRTDGPPTTARHALFDSDSDSDGGLFPERSFSLYSGKVLTPDPASNAPTATKQRQEREPTRKSNLEYHSTSNKIRPAHDDPAVSKPQSLYARKSHDKRTLFEDCNDEADGDISTCKNIPAFSEKKPAEKRQEIQVTPPNEVVKEKDLNDDKVTVNSSKNETQNEFSNQGKVATLSDISEGQPHSEKEKVEKMNTREESMIVNSGQPESAAPMANPTKHDKTSKMADQKITAPRREASLTDIFADDSDSDDIFSTLRVQSRKVINSDIRKVDRKVLNDESVAIKKAVRGEDLQKPIIKKRDERSNIFGSSTDDDEDGLFKKATPPENLPSVLAGEAGAGGTLFVSSRDEDNIFEVKNDDGEGLPSKVSSDSINVNSDSQDLRRDCADGNASSRASHPRASTSKPWGDETSGDDDDDDEEESAAATATRFGGARPKSSSRRRQNAGDINDDDVAVVGQPKRVHVPQIGAAFRNSLSDALSKGPVSPESVRGSPSPGATSLKVTTPHLKEEQAVPKADNMREVDEDQRLLTGAIKYRAKMVRPKRRPPSRYNRQKPTPQMDVADSPHFDNHDTTSPTHELSTQERPDLGSSPDPSRLPPPMPPESSRSDDSRSMGTKSPSPVGNEEFEGATKETGVPTKVVTPLPEKTELLICNEMGIENQTEYQEGQRPASYGKNQKGDMGLHTTEHKPNARTVKNKEKVSLFESSSDSEDLFAKKPHQAVAAVGNVGMQSKVSDTSSDSDDLFSSAKRKS